MHMLSRAHRYASLHAARATRRIDKLSARNAKLKREAKKLRGGAGGETLRRLRRRVGALAGRGGNG